LPNGLKIIEGVVIQELKQFVDERGRVMHMLRVDNPFFEKFGEVYFSEVLPGVVKAWKKHKLMTQLFAVPVGMIRLVIYDGRDRSRSNGQLEILDVGRDNYKLIRVPPRLWYGFKCISDHPTLLANCADLPHNPDESESKNPDDRNIPYQW